MTDTTRFEARFVARLAAHAATAVRPFDAAAVAGRIASRDARRSGSWTAIWLGQGPGARPALGGALVLVLLAIALAVGLVAVGALQLRDARPLGGVPLLIGRTNGIYIDDRDGRPPRVLRGDGSYAFARWSPSGAYLAAQYISEAGATIGDPINNTLRVLGADGHDVGHIDRVDAFAWSPVDDRILVRLLSVTGPRLAIVSPEGAILDTPTLPAGRDTYVTAFAWSPDGGRLVASLCTDCLAAGGLRPATARDDLWILDLAGRTATRVTDTPDAQEPGAAWSPDGRDVAFTVQTCLDRTVVCAGGSLWLLTPGEFRELAAGAGADAIPAWSPDGGRIAFDAVRDGRRDIFSVDRTGGGLIRLTNDPEVESNPRWSDDGGWLSFWRFVPGSEIGIEVWAVRSDGTGLTRLTTDASGIDWAPGASWP